MERLVRYYKVLALKRELNELTALIKEKRDLVRNDVQLKNKYIEIYLDKSLNIQFNEKSISSSELSKPVQYALIRFIRV